MPTYVTEYTRRYQPGEHEEGVASQKMIGPYIVAPSFEKAAEICACLVADPNGDSPIQVLGELHETYQVASMFDTPDFKAMEAHVAEVRRQVNTIIWGPNGVCDCRHDIHDHAGGKGACKDENCDCQKVTMTWKQGMSHCLSCGSCALTKHLRPDCCSNPRQRPLDGGS